MICQKKGGIIDNSDTSKNTCPMEEFVCGRHRELEKEGKKNPEIYRRIISEAGALLFVRMREW